MITTKQNMKGEEILKWTLIAGLLFTSGLLIKKTMNMGSAMIKRLIPFVEHWEGGLSRKLSDTASRFPAPWKYKGLYGWHTNKGITYGTFVSLAPKIGYKPNAKNFFEMPENIWLAILKEGYMKAYPLDRISHLPRIQAVIITWAWGSGSGGSEWRLANFQREVMGIVDSNITKTEIVENFRKRINRMTELKWFHKLCDRREEDFRKMSTFPANGKGWLRRLADFRKTFG